MPGISSRARSRSTAQEAQSRLLSFSVVDCKSLIVDGRIFFLRKLNILVNYIKVACVHAHGTSEGEQAFFFGRKFYSGGAGFW